MNYQNMPVIQPPYQNQQPNLHSYQTQPINQIPNENSQEISKKVIFCGKCGFENEVGANFCHNCGNTMNI